MEKGNFSGKEKVNVTTGYELETTTLKFKRRKMSVVWDFPPRCEREATTDLD
ncbi:hypothetical protein J1N35_040898 [Gossypium stocksii]|uniref:Uncharacterized protein n=1 Tax=Gossypium stocksii TaxID=47602 RepID=A0A9D3UEU7_9ROSI|nr:hypothetical protein J1N35_040898 [Gossypium stocksii]